MRYIALLKVILENRIKICKSEESAREWLQEQIEKEAHFMPYHDWKAKWAIFPITGIIRGREFPMKRGLPERKLS